MLKKNLAILCIVLSVISFAHAQDKYNKEGSYTAHVKGQLTMHGVTRDIETTGIIKTDGTQLETYATFTITLSDFNIKIQSIVKNKVARTIKITVDCKLEPLKG